METKKKGFITTGAMAFMTAAAVISLRGLPMMAAEEMTMFFYIAFATIFFLIPAALVSAELGSAFSGQGGGVYRWVGAAFGKKWGNALKWPTQAVAMAVACCCVGQCNGMHRATHLMAN
jgi:amino acid transporter